MRGETTADDSVSELCSASTQPLTVWQRERETVQREIHATASTSNARPDSCPAKTPQKIHIDALRQHQLPFAFAKDSIMRPARSQASLHLHLLLRLLLALAEHAALVRPVVAHVQAGPEEHVEPVDLEGQQRVDGAQGLVEAPQRNDRSQVAAGTHQRRDHRQLLRDHEGHDAVAGALCHLHADGEADQHSQGHVPRLLIVHVGERKEHETLEEEREELGPKAAGEAELGEQSVTRDATQRAGEEVHEPEAPCQDGRIAALHLEVDAEVRGELGIHGQLRAEARRVLKDHHHHPDVLQALHVVPHGGLRGLPSVCDREALRRGCVPALRLYHGSASNEENRRNNHGHAPSQVSAQAHGLQGLHEAPHNEDLRHTTSQVAPARRSGVRCAHNALGEHQGAPELVRHEGRTRASNHCADQDEAPVTEDYRRDSHPESTEGHQDGLHIHRAVTLQQRAERHAHKDRHCHGADGGVGQCVRALGAWGADTLRQDRPVVLAEVRIVVYTRILAVHGVLVVAHLAEAAVGLLRAHRLELQEGRALRVVHRRVDLVLADVDAMRHVNRDGRQGEPAHERQEEGDGGGPERTHVGTIPRVAAQLRARQVQLHSLVLLIHLGNVL
mmetsp:Transcript_52859/g.136490  ORF Transcript_52859/g.136490 Transcript_52859/m.136490 type:complete len:616 (+) Transcript_52859:153-2000(+)